MRYFACISYDGTTFFGWQKQEVSKNTVQHHLEHCLSILLRQNITTMGCGRTDSGVHAKNFYLHFDSVSEVNESDLKYHANKILPASIVIHSINKVAEDAHARFDAKERSYVYKLKIDKDPFDHFHYYYKYKDTNLAIDELNKLCLLVIQATDFTSFCKTHTDVKTNICVISNCYWKYDEATNCYEFHITANRFLRGMIRLLVGAMLNVQRNKLTLQSFENALMKQEPLPIAWSVDACGLMLFGVKY
jgi:tRNA pseudouridine38-40 synthase